jgi:hypothetical protein
MEKKLIKNVIWILFFALVFGCVPSTYNELNEAVRLKDLQKLKKFSSQKYVDKTRIDAIKGLANLSDSSEALNILLEITNANEFVEIEVLIALAKFQDFPKAKNRILKALSSKSYLKRKKVYSIIVSSLNITKERKIKILSECLNESNKGLLIHCASLLRKEGNLGAENIIYDMLDEKFLILQKRAIIESQYYNSNKFIPKLKRIAEESQQNSETRKYAIISLEKKGAFIQNENASIGTSNANFSGKIEISENFNYKDFGKYYALIIGNNEYRNLSSLKTAVNDAKSIEYILKKEYGFKTYLLINATRAQILDSIVQLRNVLRKDSNLLIYYAGHGWLDKESDRGYWLPVDAQEKSKSNWLSNVSITDEIKAMSSKHVLLVADSCYSGKLTRGVDITIKSPTYAEKMAKKRSRTVLTSGGLEPVSDSGGGNNSIFAKYFIKALKNNQNILDGHTLFSEIRRPISINSDQTPEYSDVRQAGHDGGDFLFVRKK